MAGVRVGSGGSVLDIAVSGLMVAPRLWHWHWAFASKRLGR
jgi:hypothetical protein